MSRQPGPIKVYAEELLAKVLFVDVVTKRPTGYDYKTILGLIKQRFPASRATKQVLWRWYAYNMKERGERLPVRRHSRRYLATGYARALLLDGGKHGIGVTFETIRRRVRKLFPEISLDMKRIEDGLRRRGCIVPPRPPFVVADDAN